MSLVYAIAVLGVLGAVFGLVLAVASKVFAVETDERLEPMIEALPGANCGGCGYSGCAAYAQAVLEGKAKIGLCASSAVWQWSCAAVSTPSRRPIMTAFRTASRRQRLPEKAP